MRGRCASGGRTAGIALGVVLVALGAGVAHPASGAAAGPTADRDEAERALAAARSALGGPGTARTASGAALAPRRDVTILLRDLAVSMPALERGDRREARALLARPVDSHDPHANSWSVPPAAASPYCTEHFCIHWVDSSEDAPVLADANGSGDGDGVPDYVELTADIAEHSQTVQNDALGWPAPIADGFGAPPPNEAKTDIYLAQIGDVKMFGYAAPDPPPRQRCFRSCFGYLVLDNDYAPSEFGYAQPTTPLAVTFAHEYNHVLQFAIDVIQDIWLFESTAVWAEEKAFPDANDYLNYLPALARTPGTPLTKAGGAGGRRMYAAAVWNHWLEAGRPAYGPGIVLDTWLSSTRTHPADYAVGAYDRAIRHAGGRGFAHAFAAFAASSAEWRTGPLPDAATYPDIRRQGVLRPASERRIRLDHTAWRLFRVPATGKRAVRLRVRADEHVRSAIALVGRDGGPVGGRVVIASRYLDDGGKASVRLPRPRRFERVTAAVVNADGRVAGFGLFDWQYRRDNQIFSLRLTRVKSR